MSHPICGIDVGAFSIKFVVFEIGFRQTVFRGAFEELVSDGPAPLLERQVETLREGLSRVSSDATLYLALPGDALSIRSLELPFADHRKIDQVIGYELEGQIVYGLEDVVYDHVVVRSGDDGASVLAVAARRDFIVDWLEALKTKGIDPRALYAAPVVYHTLAIDDGVSDEPAAFEVPKVPAILDLGHARSNLFVGRDGQGISARTITRGGAHLTTAIAEALGVDVQRAEQIKRGEARLLSGAATAPRASEARIDQALRGALVPLTREIRQTLASFRAASHLDVSALYVTGGAARLKGMLPFLEDELGLPALFLRVPNTLQASLEDPLPRTGTGGFRDADDLDGDSLGLDETTRISPRASESSPFALATAIVLAASRGSKEIDLRRGPFLYRASFSVLRQKAAHLGLLAAAILVAGGLDVFAALSNLGTERKALDLQLKTTTQELFGAPRADARTVTQLLRKGFREELAPVPKATAYDLLDQISKRMPPADRIKLDITELEIRPKKTFIKGTVDSATAVDEISEKLKEIDCYDEVTKGTVTEVSDGAKQFTLNVGSKCP